MTSANEFADMRNLGERLLGNVRHAIARQTWLRQRRRHGLPIIPEPQEVLNHPYLFVLSTGRCGTKLLTEIFSRSPDLWVEHSPKPELEYVSSIVHREEYSLNALQLAVLAARFDLFFMRSYCSGKIYTETNNRITLFAPALAKLLPNARFIHLVRDPAAFVRSGMRRGYYDAGVVQHQRLDGSRLPYWGSFTRLEKIAWEWNEINTRIEDFKANVDESRTLTIKSESLYRDTAITAKLFDFIGIDSPFQGERGARALCKMISRPVNAQKAGNFPEFTEWSPPDKAALKRVAKLAKKYDYPLS